MVMEKRGAGKAEDDTSPSTSLGQLLQPPPAGSSASVSMIMGSQTPSSRQETFLQSSPINKSMPHKQKLGPSSGGLV